MSKGWDSGMLKKLKSLVGKGLSTSEMGKKLGMSKNAVIGKLNRLGWNSKTIVESTKNKTVGKTAVKKEKKVVVAKKEPVKKEKVGAKKTVKPAIVEKKQTSKKTVAADSKTTTKAKTKASVAKLPEIKPASKKNKKDLALHELLIQHALQMANLKPNQCRWPIGDPDSDNFHFCGETVFAGKPYCYEHCRQAYQFTAPKKK